MSKLPLYYDHINSIYSHYSPSTIHVRNTSLFNFFAKKLLMKFFNVYDIQIPEKWDKNFFLYTVFGTGYVAVFNTRQYGVIPMNASLTGYNVFYQPHRATVTNPLFDRTYELTIGRDCELIYLQPDYTGVMDIVAYYADMMAITSETLAVNTYNSRLAYIFLCGDKSAKASYQSMMDQILAGNPASFLYKNGMVDEATGRPNYELFNNNLKQGLIAPELQESLREWEFEFCREAGIPAQSTEKKQRMTEDEVNATAVETSALAEVRLECLQSGFEKVRAMFGISGSDLSVDWKHDPEETMKSLSMQSELSADQKEGGNNGQR